MDAPCAYVPPWEYSCPVNLESSCALLPTGSLIGRDAGPSNCGIIEISWASLEGDLPGEFLIDSGSYPDIERLTWGIAK